MPLIIIGIVVIVGFVVYMLINPAGKIKSSEIRELETLDEGYGETIEKLLSETQVSSAIVERYFYLKHKYNLTKTK